MRGLHESGMKGTGQRALGLWGRTRTEPRLGRRRRVFASAMTCGPMALSLIGVGSVTVRGLWLETRFRPQWDCHCLAR